MENTFLYSIAIGVAIVGVLIILGLAGTMMVVGAFSGFPLQIFVTFSNLPNLGVIFVTLYALASAGGGIYTAISLGYQPADLLILILSGAVAFLVAVIVGGILHAVTESFERRIQRKESYEYAKSRNS